MSSDKKIKKALKVVVDDIYDLAHACHLSSSHGYLNQKIEIPIKTINVNPKLTKSIYCNKEWHLLIYLNTIWLMCDDDYKNGMMLNNQQKIIVPRNSRECDILCMFLANYYEYNRVIIAEEMAKLAGYDHHPMLDEVLVQLQLPEGNSPSKIVLSNEDGRQVATINVGKKMIKLVTTNEISLVDRDDIDKKEKQKVKEKAYFIGEE